MLGPTLEHSSSPRDRYYEAVANYRDNHLEHHGVLGQKWGVRRYQNPDGTLTTAGKKRYSDSDLEEIKKASSRFGIIGGLVKKHQIDKRNAEAEKEASKTELDKTKLMAGNKDDTATLGLKALQKMGRDIGVDDIEDTDREWFLYEDQTIGLPVVADLVAQGKSKDQIISMAKEANDRAYDEKYANMDEHVWELAELGGTKELPKFIDACQEVMKDKNWKDSKVDRSNTASTKEKPSKPMNEAERKDFQERVKKSAMVTAKQSNMYDYRFLEAVQNETWADRRGKNFDKERMLSEYEKFLDNPGDYWKYRDH